jgi:hypothetical protein
MTMKPMEIATLLSAKVGTAEVMARVPAAMLTDTVST